MESKSTIRVAVLLEDGVELVDMNGPIDVFLHANRLSKRTYEVYTVAASKGEIRSEGDVVTIRPAYTVTDCPTPDVVIIPGILTHDQRYKTMSPALIQFINDCYVSKPSNASLTIMSVCVGFFSLAATGLLDGLQATTHYRALEEAQRKFPSIKMIKNKRYVPAGGFITTGGITSGIDGALYLLEQFDGADIAQQVADILVYNRDAPLPPGTILP